ncbi:MAG: hypothetical protein C0446_14190 [Chitinophaga sp.]|nr:hypothetical protein [Chitinophaga sp.]
MRLKFTLSQLIIPLSFLGLTQSSFGATAQFYPDAHSQASQTPQHTSCYAFSTAHPTFYSRTGVVLLSEDVTGMRFRLIPEGRERASSSSSNSSMQHELIPMKVDLRQTAFEHLSHLIRQAASSNGMVELDMSCRNMHDETLDALMSDLDPAVLQNVVQVDLNGNNLSVEGIQSLIPLIANPGFRWLNISDNQIEGEDLFTQFATTRKIVESADVERDNRLILDEQTRLELLEKIIWLPRAFFGVDNPNKNPHGLYITKEVVARHRTYYGLVQ